MTQENSLRIDFMKFVCAVMVVAIHSGCPMGTPCDGAWLARQLFWRDGITLIAVPFFFVCSGYFVARHLDSRAEWLLAVRKRIRTLVVPFFIWSFVAVVAMPFLINMAGDLAGSRPFGTTLWSSFRGRDWLAEFGACWGCPLLVPIWYVRNLFFLVLTAPVLMFLLRKLGKTWLVVSFGASLLYWFLPANDFKMFLLRFYSVLGVFYFSLGIYLHENGVTGVARLNPIGGGGKMLVAGVVVSLWMIKLAFAAAGYEALQHAFESISIPFVLLLVWRLVPARRLPCWIANMSFPIYVLHYIVIRWLNGVVNQVSVFSAYPQICAILRLLIAVFASLVIAHLLRRFPPRFARIAFGDR
jgi:peptidoglycan/LPS O-acetylase OafA/YrhL